MKPSTDEGLPLYVVGGGDPERMIEEAARAMDLADLAERAVRLYFIGRGLLDCDDKSFVDVAVALLYEAMTLGSPHAAYDLGLFLMQTANSPTDVAIALGYIETAAVGGHDEARQALASFPRPA